MECAKLAFVRFRLPTALLLSAPLACSRERTAEPVITEGVAPQREAAPAWLAPDEKPIAMTQLAWDRAAARDRAGLVKAARDVCPPELCKARKFGHLIDRVEGAPNAVLTSKGLVLLSDGDPLHFIGMAVGPGGSASAWADGKILVDSPRYRQLYVVDAKARRVLQSIERQPSDGKASLFAVSPDHSVYVYVTPDRIALAVSARLSAPQNIGADVPTGTRAFWSDNKPRVTTLTPDLPTLVRPGDETPLNGWEQRLRDKPPAAMPAASIKTTFQICDGKLVAVCSDKKCVAQQFKSTGPESVALKPLLTVPDPTPDVLDNNAGFAFVDGEHHEVVLVGCDGKLTRRPATAGEEMHHISAEAEMWRSQLETKLCTARDAVLPAIACDELDVPPTGHVP